MKQPGQRKISFIVVWMILIFGIRAGAQPIDEAGGKLRPAGLVWKASKSGAAWVQSPGTLLVNAFAQTSYVPQKMPGADYYLEHTGFFCKKEWEFEKTVHLPLRFRIGSLEYCNFLEGKNKNK
jgi:hypothetical protein